jgi:hypothetical protein
VAVEAVGAIAAAGGQPSRRRRRRLRVCLRKPRRRLRWLPAWPRSATPPRVVNPLGLALATLRGVLADPSAAVRTQAARALGQIGPAAASEAPALIALLADDDETVRCQAA